MIAGLYSFTIILNKLFGPFLKNSSTSCLCLLFSKEIYNCIISFILSSFCKLKCIFSYIKYLKFFNVFSFVLALKPWKSLFLLRSFSVTPLKLSSFVHSQNTSTNFFTGNNFFKT